MHEYYEKYRPIVEKNRERLESCLPGSLEERTKAWEKNANFNSISLARWDAEVGVYENETTGIFVTINPYRRSTLNTMLNEGGMVNSISNGVALLKATAYYQILNQKA